jgi:phosphotransferase system  glucose/maltose/N-acetylglucosamine-specific IIC component
MDAARVLPVFCAILFLIPLLWSSDGATNGNTSTGVVYVFIISAGLIVGAAFVARFLGRVSDVTSPGAAGEDADGETYTGTNTVTDSDTRTDAGAGTRTSAGPDT